MNIPYVIDNDRHKLADILNDLLHHFTGCSLDIATAYFTVTGFALLREGLAKQSSFRLLLGAEFTSGQDLGLRPRETAYAGLITQDLERLPFDEATLRAVEDLIAYLRREAVDVRLYEKGFLHAKCYLFYADRLDGPGAFERFKPVAGIVGSSNFTRPGLTTNRELNLAHKVLLDSGESIDADAHRAVSWLADDRSVGFQPASLDSKSQSIDPATARQLIKSEVGARAIIDLERWYDTQWQASRDFKDDLIRILDESKFGQKEYTPYEIYLKALYEYFKEEMSADDLPKTRSVVDLAEFQEDAVKKARRILTRYDGVMIADSVGLGKTWIGKKLLEDFAYHMRQKALVICPASLRQMWLVELRDSTIAAHVLSQEELARDTFDPAQYHDADLILIDESHNFRNPNALRYEQLERLIGGNRGRGRDGARKKIILLSATPINNDLFDLYNQLRLITQNDQSYFAGCGIGDLRRYFLAARRASRTGDGLLNIFNLLEEIVIRRTRPFIRQAYPDATIRGEKIHFPERRLKTVTYDLEATYGSIYEEIVNGIERLELAPYHLEAYVREGVERNDMEQGREEALVGIFKSRYLKRFESSVHAFRISVHRALAFQKTFESYILDGRLMRSTDFQNAMRYLEREDEEDDATPRSLAEEMDDNEEAREFLEHMALVDPARYDLRKLHDAVQRDVEILTEIWQRVRDIKPEHDAKLARLKSLLQNELRGQKVLIFTYYKDTARYLFRELGNRKNESAVAFLESIDNPNIRRMDGGASPKERVRIVQGFAPEANRQPELKGTDKEIDILISTDVLSEGQNLQDCGHLLNFDLHWNPTRMVQRAGRVDRIGSRFDTLWLYNMFPDAGLERLLRLVERLSQRISDIDRAGFLDASVLGELVHPQNFNTLRRIKEEDGSVIRDEEAFAELASSEFLEQTLRQFLDTHGRERLDTLPDGIHSGLVREGARGVFFYFQGRRSEGKLHFWRYYDLKTHTVHENRYLIANMVVCQRDTPRVVDPDIFRQVFDIQERVTTSILKDFQQQQALEAAPRSIDPVQQTVATILQASLNNPAIDRAKAMTALRFLSSPLLQVQIKALRAACSKASNGADPGTLLDTVLALAAESGATDDLPPTAAAHTQLSRDDLRLICFDFLSS